MSKLHVKQIEGHLSQTVKATVDMSDYAGHSDMGKFVMHF